MGPEDCAHPVTPPQTPGEEIMNYVYLLRCSDDTLYCGWTTDLAARLAAHNGGSGAKYTRSRLPVELVYYEAHSDRHEALSREWHIKRMTRGEKLKLIKESGR
jgi:putative endonuclease